MIYAGESLAADSSLIHIESIAPEPALGQERRTKFAGLDSTAIIEKYVSIRRCYAEVGLSADVGLSFGWLSEPNSEGAGGVAGSASTGSVACWVSPRMIAAARWADSSASFLSSPDLRLRSAVLRPTSTFSSATLASRDAQDDRERGGPRRIGAKPRAAKPHSALLLRIRQQVKGVPSQL